MSDAFVKYGAPSIGGVTGLIMLLSPSKAVWDIRQSQTLGVRGS